MFLRQTSPPAIEPISLAEAKLHLRVDIPDDDALILSLISAAREAAEGECNRAFITQSWQLVLDSFCDRDAVIDGAIWIDKATVNSIQSVQYMDMTGAWQTMPSTDWVADLVSEPARITPAFGKIWPITMPQIGSVKINFTSGYGATADSVPYGIKAWMKLQIAALYENRSRVVADSRIVALELPFADRLLDNYRVDV